MPAFSTHYLFARELMEQIEAMTPETRLDPDAVYYGTQGPDVLFFSSDSAHDAGEKLQPGRLANAPCKSQRSF